MESGGYLGIGDMSCIGGTARNSIMVDVVMMGVVMVVHGHLVVGIW